MNKQKVILSLCSILICALSGCGLSGPLYQEKPEQPPTSSSQEG